LACVPLHANYIDFWIQNTLLHNIQPDRYKDSGIIMGTASPGGLCIGDVAMGQGQDGRQLFLCDNTGTLSFSFVDPKGGGAKLKPDPTDAVVLVVGFLCNNTHGDPWKVSLYDANHSLVETRTGNTLGPLLYQRHYQTLLFFHGQRDIASAEFEVTNTLFGPIPNGGTFSSVALVYFNAGGH
jgi:hypothetical protein